VAQAPGQARQLGRRMSSTRRGKKLADQRLARGVDVPKDKAIPCAVEVINAVCRAQGISPEVEFKL